MSGHAKDERQRAGLLRTARTPRQGMQRVMQPVMVRMDQLIVDKLLHRRLNSLFILLVLFCSHFHGTKLRNFRSGIPCFLTIERTLPKKRLVSPELALEAPNS